MVIYQSDYLFMKTHSSHFYMNIVRSTIITPFDFSISLRPPCNFHVSASETPPAVCFVLLWDRKFCIHKFRFGSQ